MRFNRKIAPEFKPRQSFITKKWLREDEIDFDKLRSYRLDRVRKELEKNNLESCILFYPVNVRYALYNLNEKPDAKYMFLIAIKDIEPGEELVASYTLYTFT